MRIEIQGLEDAKSQLESLQRRARGLNGEHMVPLSELFPLSFMTKYTDFASFDEMVQKSGFEIESEADFAAVPRDEWSAFIEAHSRFDGWDEMLAAAGREYIATKMGF